MIQLRSKDFLYNAKKTEESDRAPALTQTARSDSSVKSIFTIRFLISFSLTPDVSEDRSP